MELGGARRGLGFVVWSRGVCLYSVGWMGGWVEPLIEFVFRGEFYGGRKGRGLAARAGGW